MNTRLFDASSIKIKRHISVFEVVCGLFLSLYVLSFFLLFYFALINAFKGTLDFLNDPIGLPDKWEFGNLGTMFDNFKVKVGSRGPTYYIELLALFGLIYAIGCAVATTLVCLITAYATSQFNYKFSKIVYGAVIFAMIFPVVGNLPSEMQMVRTLHLYDSFLGNFVLKANFLGLYYLALFAAFGAIPKDFKEAAKVDGASNLRIMTHIMIPLVRNTVFTILLIHFIVYWNDYQTPLLYLPSKPTLALGLYYFSISTSAEIADMPVKLCACLAVFLPIFVVFIVFQKRLIGNVSMGGIKG